MPCCIEFTNMVHFLFLLVPSQGSVLLSFLFEVSEDGEWEAADNVQEFCCSSLEENVTKQVCRRDF